MPCQDVLLVSSRRSIQQPFDDALAKYGLKLAIAESMAEAETILKTDPIALIFCSDEMPSSDIDALIRQDWRQEELQGARIPVIMVSRLDDCEQYLRFLRAGAFDYVLYPPVGREFERILRLGLKAAETRKTRQAVSAA
jgi:DNA-binding response OmpR family regulator